MPVVIGRFRTLVFCSCRQYFSPFFFFFSSTRNNGAPNVFCWIKNLYRFKCGCGQPPMSRPEILFLIMVSVWGLSNLRAKTGEKIAKLIWAEHDFCETGIREHEVLHSPWNAWKMSICATSTVSGYQVVLQHSSSSIRDINGFVDTSHSGPSPCIPASLRTSLRMCMNYSMLHFFFSACSYGTHCFCCLMGVP